MPLLIDLGAEFSWRDGESGRLLEELRAMSGPLESSTAEAKCAVIVLPRPRFCSLLWIIVQSAAIVVPGPTGIMIRMLLEV